MPLSFAISSAACWKPGADASIYENFPVAVHVIRDEVPPLPQRKLPTKRRLSSWCKAMLVCGELACSAKTARADGEKSGETHEQEARNHMAPNPQGLGQFPARSVATRGEEDPRSGQEVRKLSDPSVPTIFASKHGEWAREVGMLIDYTRGEGVSQGGFSLSVHNVAASLFSISQENSQPYSAIAAGDETFEAGLLEAVMHLEKYERVLLVVGDEQAPKVPSVSDTPPFPDVVSVPQVHALMLTRGNDFALESASGTSLTLSAHDFFSFAGSSAKELCGATIKVSVC